MTYGIHWFRRDLRTAGNPALRLNAEKHRGRVVGIFCFDKKFLARPDFSPARFQFFLDTLASLREDLHGELLVLDEGPDQAFEWLKEALGTRPATISFNRDYEPYAVARDARLTKFFERWETEVVTSRDHLLIEPHEIEKAYQVYTPFSKTWMDLFKTPAVQERLGVSPAPKLNASWAELLGEKLPKRDVLEEYRRHNGARVTITIPKAGTAAARTRVRAFREKLDAYDGKRDIPSEAGTSGFSIYLKNGSLTVAEVIGMLDLRKGKFLSELVWREFYYHILARHPRVETEAFNVKYADIRWENDEKLFEAWKEGRTGYPIVDAGMRQLNQRGWMHNRVRMIVASFLTKDLLIDWRWGERYFMEKLLDGDLAPNNGGWQWAASTGCDPQPYFRIFNPKLQQDKFDPEGKYVRKYVPEVDSPGYPAPIVDHHEQRTKALALYGAKK